ncbi:MAG: discoidin domain-containing protein [Acidobacteriia bacterium]|nr:discoidin domain-containing protein [Terriglobia bacterium]
MKRFLLCLILIAIALFTVDAQPYTRGVGVYPGDPKENFAPALVPDMQTYRNLALRRPAYQSSAYDYNLTAQLVTDGIKETAMPRWVVVSTSQQGVIRKQDREHLLDHNDTSTLNLPGGKAWIQVEMAGGDAPLQVDRVEFSRLSAMANASLPAGYTVVVNGSDDGRTWTEVGRLASQDRPPGRGFGGFGGPGGGPGRGAAPPPQPSVKFNAPSHNRIFRIEFEAPSATAWTLSEVMFYNQRERVEAGGPYHFASAWKPAGNAGEWVYVDLGAPATFDRVSLYWIRRAADGAIQASDDAKTWRTVQLLPASGGPNDDLKLEKPARGRYVRLFLTKPATPDGYALSEMEVYGRGGLVAQPHAAPLSSAGGRLQLAGGAWRIQRDSLVAADGAALSKTGFDDKDWLPATVPGTVLSSYWDSGAIADPGFGTNQLNISDSYFWADFWYRDEFAAPPLAAGRHMWLNFTGINWKALVYLNGEELGRIDGGFMRGKFDVTGKIKPGQKNALAVRILKNATPGSIKEKVFERPDLNGGALGADNPTYHATAGWDWIPTVRGRDAGIWAEVFLNTTGGVSIENPLASTTLPLPDISRADVAVEATLRNSDQKPVSGTLRGRFGTIAFETPVTVEAGSTKVVKFDPSTTPALRLQNPKLWWPNGYGEQNLYDVSLSFVAGGRTSDSKAFKTGVKQYAYSVEARPGIANDANTLKIWINGRRFVARGGNWGFPEELLRYRAREYDWAVRYHKDMNFTMIRNWVGQTGDDEFYDACDRYGIVVWQDFWLANPVDGPNPDDPNLFLKNAEDYIFKIRNHPSVGIYVGRNEGNPPEPINSGLAKLTAALHPNLYYIPNSAMGPVSGGGPYNTQAPKFYFQNRATTKLHSELGMPNVMTMDSIRQTMRPEDIWPQFDALAAKTGGFAVANLPESWPQGDVWGMHDFTYSGAQGARTWLQMIDRNYGGAKTVEDFVALSQFIDYDGYRAMFEAQGKNRMGLLLWMSHPCWPSFVWQTYDYFFDQSGAYFGSKKGSEPLHIQWNPTTDNVEVVNYSGGNATGLTARIEVLDMDGSMKWEKSATLDSKEDSVETPIKIEFPAGLTPVHFLRLKLTRGTAAVSENFYLRGLEETQPPAPPAGAPQQGMRGGSGPLGWNLQAIRNLPKVKIDAATRVEQKGGRWFLSTELHNASKVPALMVRVKAVREKSGDRILPAIYNDNYVPLMPGERRTIATELENEDTRGERPRIVVEGFNVAK